MTLVLLAPGRSCHAYERTDDVVLVVRGWLLDLVEVNKCRHGRDVRGSSWKTPATHQCECVAVDGVVTRYPATQIHPVNLLVLAMENSMQECRKEV